MADRDPDRSYDRYGENEQSCIMFFITICVWDLCCKGKGRGSCRDGRKRETDCLICDVHDVYVWRPLMLRSANIW